MLPVSTRIDHIRTQISSDVGIIAMSSLIPLAVKNVLTKSVDWIWYAGSTKDGPLTAWVLSTASIDSIPLVSLGARNPVMPPFQRIWVTSVAWMISRWISRMDPAWHIRKFGSTVCRSG